jgi:hypothetical protein
MCEYPDCPFHSVCACAYARQHVTKHVEQAPNKPSSVDYLPRLWSQAFFQISANILGPYGTELPVLGSCGDWKEVRCHDSRTRPSTARVKGHHSFSANRSAVGSSPRFAPLFWPVAQPVFEQVQAVTVMRVWAERVLILKLSQRLSTAVYSPSGINDTLPRVIHFSNDHFVLLS